MKIYGYSVYGYEGALVRTEADLRSGIPAVDILGLADGSVKESRERMRAAIKGSGFCFPEGRVLISLAPADLKKEGTGFDLAMALAVLDAQHPQEYGVPSVLCHAELELSGRLRPVRGTYAALQSASNAGIRDAIIASGTPDAEIPQGINAFPAKNLKEAFKLLGRLGKIAAVQKDAEAGGDGVTFPVDGGDGTIDDIKNPALARAMMIAAAGRHHLLAVGSPGCGKTLALRHFPELLPALTVEESVTVARIHSIAGLVSKDVPFVRTPPFRMPHQSASLEGMCGGGIRCMPGEISLAHNGVLFLDEAAEFRTAVLQMLRVPLESGAMTLCRAGRSTIYPASFQPLMAASPCPCGNYGSTDRLCLCSAHAVGQYWRKFSAPLLDRIAIRIQVTERQGSGAQPTLAEMRGRIATATKKQRERGRYNQHLAPHEVLSLCVMDGRAKSLFDGLTGISERARTNVLRVARTIADLDGVEEIESEHIEEAARLATWTLPLMM